MRQQQQEKCPDIQARGGARVGRPPSLTGSHPETVPLYSHKGSLRHCPYTGKLTLTY